MQENYHIIPLSMGMSMAYIIKTTDGLILVDTGGKRGIKNLQSILKDINCRFKDIKLIIVTHVHQDHVGSLHAIKEKTGAYVLVHREESQNLKRGTASFPPGTNIFYRFISGIADILIEDSFPGVKPDIIIDNNFDLKEFGIYGRVIHTPGHTPGSISLIIEENYCITGDTFFNLLPHTIYPPFAVNQRELRGSWYRIKKLNCRLYYPGHGRVFDGKKFLREYNNL